LKILLDAVSPGQSDERHDRELSGKGETMTSDAIESNATAIRNAEGPAESNQEVQAGKEGCFGQKSHTKRTAEPTNKKAEVIALMKHAKGATLTEIMKATGWQARTVRPPWGFLALRSSRAPLAVKSANLRSVQRLVPIIHIIGSHLRATFAAVWPSSAHQWVVTDY
jgi:hypothetical protein